MIPVSLFALDTTEQTSEGPRSRLIFGGRPLGIAVAGAVLEAQFAMSGEFLLFVTDDCPYEEVLHLYLIDAGMAVADQVDIGGPYAPGIVRDLEPAGPASLEFSFIGTERWRVTVRDTARGLIRKHRIEISRRAASGPLLS